MPFNARRGTLIIEFAYHSVLKLDKSGKTQISPSRPWQANRELAQSHHHPGAQRPRSETDQLEEQRRVHHCSSKLYKELACLYSKKRPRT